MIRLAVIGRNFVVDSMIEAMKHVPELELCGICSRSAEGAREFGERYGIDPAHRYVGIHALAHAEDIDAVYIATPIPYMPLRRSPCSSPASMCLWKSPPPYRLRSSDI